MKFNRCLMSKKNVVTIYDIAEELNVSVSTVSRGLKDDPLVSRKTKKKIFDLAQEMGYRANHLARNLRAQKTNTIGLMIHELNSNFSNSVLSGIEKVAREEGYDLIIAHSSENYEREVANALNLFNKVDGLIASLSFNTKKYDHFSWFSDKEVPVVFFDRVEKNNGNMAVVIDNYKCGYEATMHLIEQGCRRIVHITSSLTRNVYIDRFRGYKDALNDAGITFDEKWVMGDGLSEDVGIESAAKIMKMNPIPDGAFVANDFVAATFIKALKVHKLRVPDDIAVVGFNDDSIARLIEPSLTTINYPGIAMGETAAELLINKLKGISTGDQANTVVIETALVIRESSQKRKID